MGALLAGFVGLLLAADHARLLRAHACPDPIEILLALLATCFAIGALGLLGFRAPLVARRLFGDKGPKPIIPLGDDGEDGRAT